MTSSPIENKGVIPAEAGIHGKLRANKKKGVLLWIRL